jgi:hypothetical protein
MRSNYLALFRVLSALALTGCIFATGFALPNGWSAQTQEQTKPKVSEAETKAVAAINSALDAAAKLVAAGEFIKKHPKSAYRADVVAYVASEIGQVADPNQKVKLAEDYQKLFKEPDNLEPIHLVMIDGLLALKRIDDAFSQAAALLAKHPDNVAVMSQLAFTGTEEAKRQNAKYVPVSLQYGLKSIELIEANKKPADIDDARWERQKTMLPQLYLTMGILSLVSSNPAEAKARFEKASQLDPSEPTAYALLGQITDDEYQQLAQTHKGMPDGPQKNEALVKATEKMDKVIDLYARALGASAGKPEHKVLNEQVLQAVTPYYKFRHNGSTEGLQQLIDKYKTPAKP